MIALWSPAIRLTASKPTPAATNSQTVGGVTEKRDDLFGSDGRRIAQAQQMVAVFGELLRWHLADVSPSDRLGGGAICEDAGKPRISTEVRGFYQCGLWSGIILPCHPTC